MVSAPFAFGFGVYLYAPVAALVMAAVPFVPLLTIVKVSASPSTSFATSVPVADMSSSVVSVPAEATGASFTGRDSDGHRRGVGVHRAVVRRVREAVRPVVVRRRRIREAAVRIQRQRAVARTADQDRVQAVAVDIAVVGEHARRRHRQHRVFVRAVAIVGRHRRVVDRRDGDGHGRGVRVGRLPSLALNVMVSTPLAFGFGVYLNAPVAALVMAAVPFVPLLTIVNVSASPSTSFATSVPVAGMSSSVVSVPAEATGASLTAAMAMDTVAVLESTVPSFAAYVKLSDPL